jgi:hypothetical protein
VWILGWLAFGARLLAQSLTSDPNNSKSDPNKLNDASERDCIKMPAATAESLSKLLKSAKSRSGKMRAV